MNNSGDFAQAKSGNRAWVIYLVCVSSFMLSMYYRVSVTVISPQLAVDLRLNASQLGDLSAAFFYGYAISQLPLGMVLERWGARRCMTVLNGLAVLGALAFALAPSGSVAIVGRVLLGVGMGCNFIGSVLLISAWFPPNRFATLNGIIVGAGSAGQLLAATPLVYVTQAVGWRGAFVVMAALTALQVGACWWILRDNPAGASPAPRIKRESRPQSRDRLLTHPCYWVISVGTFFRYGCFMALLGLWAGPYLMNGLGLNQVQTGNALLFLSLGYTIGLPLWGRVSDGVAATRKWIILPALFASALLTLFLGLMEGMSAWVLYGLFFGLGLMTAPGQIMYPHIKELLPPALAARALTGINLYTMLGAATLMQIGGLLVGGDPGAMQGIEGYWPVWLFMAGSLCLSGCLYLFIPDSDAVRGQRLARPDSRVDG